METIDRAWVARMLPRRKKDGHKGDFGRDYILAGSVGLTGAPCLAARSCVRTGAGLVTLGVPAEIYPIVAVKCDEAMPYPLPEDDEAVLEKAALCDAVLIGPGLGQGTRAERLVLYLLERLTCPVVLDADGLNILARHIDVLDKRKAATILTPHDGEFARLWGGALTAGDRALPAQEFAQTHGCVLVRKGHRTIIAAPDGRAAINTTGNCGMAKGGSGDALSGVLLSLLGQGAEAYSAACMAVWLHGRAGDRAAAEQGEYGMTIGDLIVQLPHAMQEAVQKNGKG